MDFVEQIELLRKQISTCESRKQRRLLHHKLAAYGNQRGKCVFCKEMMFASSTIAPTSSKLATIEHVMPKCQGGANDKSNLVASCRRCNNARADMDFDAFLYVVESVSYEEIKRTAMALNAIGTKTFCEVVAYLMFGKVNVAKYERRGY